MPSYELRESRAGHVLVWDWPKEGARYVIGADVAEGRVRDQAIVRRRIETRKERPDYSAAVILELETAEHVATWHGYENTLDYAKALYALGLEYNQALVVPEINGPGLAVVEYLLRVLKYPNLYRTKLLGRSAMQPEGELVEYGWRTTDTGRAELVLRVQEAVAEGFCRTRDRRLVKELRTLQYDDLGKPRAKGVDKDDLFIAYGLALRGRYELLVGLEGQPPAEEPAKPGPDDWVWKHKDRLVALWQKRRGRLPVRQ